MPMRAPRVRIWYLGVAQWRVIVEGDNSDSVTGGRRAVEVARYKTRDAANAYARTLRRALRGH
jgi:hypothetical protein